jgi:hypothetical protein
MRKNTLFVFGGLILARSYIEEKTINNYGFYRFNGCRFFERRGYIC